MCRLQMLSGYTLCNETGLCRLLIYLFNIFTMGGLNILRRQRATTKNEKMRRKMAIQQLLYLSPTKQLLN